MPPAFESQIYRTDPADEIHIQGTVRQSLKMDPHVAALLLADVNLSDYTEVAKTAAAKLPVLHVVKQQASTAARKWLEANTPDAELHALGGHMMFWEHADRFNRVLSRFLDANLRDWLSCTNCALAGISVAERIGSRWSGIPKE